MAEMNIEELDFEVKTYNRLKKAGINTERSIYHVSKNKHA